MTTVDAAREADRLGTLVVGIVLHLWKHPKHVKGCAICEHIRSGRWPR